MKGNHFLDRPIYDGIDPSQAKDICDYDYSVLAMVKNWVSTLKSQSFSPPFDGNF